jgi:hypothetical protein
MGRRCGECLDGRVEERSAAAVDCRGIVLWAQIIILILVYLYIFTAQYEDLSKEHKIIHCILHALETVCLMSQFVVN